MRKTGEVNEWSVKFDLDFNDVVWLLYMVMWSISSSTDISSGTDWSVYQHTVVLANELPSFTVEQCKGDTADTADNSQRYIVDRAFWVKGDSFTISGEDGDVIGIETMMKALWIFDIAELRSDADAWSSVDISVNTVEWITTDDSVYIYDDTPQGESDAVAAVSPTNKTVQIATLGNSYTIANNAKIELAPQTPSYGTDPQHASLFDCKFQFADAIGSTGAAAETNVDSRELSYNNNLNARKWTKRPGAGRVDAQRSTAQLTFKKVFETKAERDKFLSTAKRALKLTIDSGVIISATDTNEATYKVVFNMANIRYDAFPIATGNDAIYEIEATCEVLYDSSAGYAIQAVVDNANAWTVYTSTS